MGRWRNELKNLLIKRAKKDLRFMFFGLRIQLKILKKQKKWGQIIFVLISQIKYKHMDEENKNINENPSAGSGQFVQKDLDELKTKCEEYLNGWKRERADFLNYKKDEMERISQLVKYANEELILKIIPILDNFYLAEKHIPENNEFKDGFAQIKKQLYDLLSKEGIEAIKTIGEKFDPNTMEAIEEVNLVKSDLTKSDEEKDVVVEEVQHGYTMHGKVIRPAKVRVTK